MSITKVGNGVDAGDGGIFGRWTVEAHIPGDDKAPEMEWTLQLCYEPEEEGVEGVLDQMELAGAQGETGALSVLEQRRGAMAANFVRRITGSMAGRLGSR